MLDFKEIPSPTEAAGRDKFEEFCGEFFECYGLKVISGPNRGPDGGVDLILEETREGVQGASKLKWLASCKHNAHGGKSVGEADDQNLVDRLTQHGCLGFIGFYSTVPSSALENRINKLGFEKAIFGPEKIARYILQDSKFKGIAKRFFPISFGKFKIQNPDPIDYFDGANGICCKTCGKELLNSNARGNLVFLSKFKDRQIIECDAYCASKDCDKREYRNGIIDKWESINDLKNPTIFIRHMFAIINSIRGGEIITDEAWETYRRHLVEISRYIIREHSDEEIERVESLKMLWDSGLG
jgi:hypothetical protein